MAGNSAVQDLTSIWRHVLTALAVLGICFIAHSAQAQETQSTGTDARPAKVDQLLEILKDPDVQGWLEQEKDRAPAPVAEEQRSFPEMVADRIQKTRTHFGQVIAALPTMPAELKSAWVILSLEFEDRGLVEIGLLIIGFVGLGFGAEWAFRWANSGTLPWLISLPLDTVRQRLIAIAARFAFGFGMLVAFAVGSVGAFVAFDWPPLLREIVLGYLLAFLAVRLTWIVSRFLLAPGAERFRIIPMSTLAAWYWHVRLTVLSGWFVFGWVTVSVLRTLRGPASISPQIVAYALGLGLLIIGFEIAWRQPRESAATSPSRHHLGRKLGAILLSLYFVLLWCLWVLSAMPSFWLILTAGALPAALGVTKRAVNHILRPADDAATVMDALPDPFVVALERGARAIIIIATALLLAHAWDIDLVELTARDTLTTRLMRGALNAVVILLVANFLWHVMKALIDRKIAEARDPGLAETEEARRRARLRTLLPIFRNILFVVLLAISALMILSAMGVEIGPLIAGAGVVGVAVGFGAQTLVKDIISGIFYLLDDAFRVGEYIQSSSYKGTVESFSLRSIKLRHHRGPLYTVPFGELGAVQNMSRDWVIDKMTISVTYDTNLTKVKKLIKEVGKDLLNDPECKPHIIETLKMQGVERFADFAIEIRMKMMTKPGEQFVIRRKAYAIIKKVFDENGVKFAYPTVQVAGGEEAATAAAAKQALPPPEPLEAQV